METEVEKANIMKCGHFKTFHDFVKLAEAQRFLLQESSVAVPKNVRNEYDRLIKIVEDMQKFKVEVQVGDDGDIFKQEIPIREPNNQRKDGTRKNAGVPPYTCGICRKNYPSWGSLKTHMSFGHKGATTYTCEFCGDGFYIQKHWKLHLIEQHSCPRPYGCSVCPKRFRLRSMHRFHYSLHQRRERHMCLVCGRKFKHGAMYRHHIRSHANEKPYQCDLCHKRFQRTRGLKIHTIKKHTLDFPFYCELCYQGFVNTSSLRTHLKTCRQDANDLLTPTANKKMNGAVENPGRRGRPRKSPGDAEETNQCHKCGKCFAYRNGLRVHQRIHTGDKPFKCNLCDRPFRQFQHLQSHLRTHTGEEPYKCEYCGKRFKLSGNYQNHVIRMHTHDYPHVCDECGKGFTERREMKKHIEKFHFHHMQEVTTLTLHELV